MLWSKEGIYFHKKKQEKSSMTLDNQMYLTIDKPGGCHLPVSLIILSWCKDQSHRVGIWAWTIL